MPRWHALLLTYSGRGNHKAGPSLLPLFVRCCLEPRVSWRAMGGTPLQGLTLCERLRGALWLRPGEGLLPEGPGSVTTEGWCSGPTFRL